MIKIVLLLLVLVWANNVSASRDAAYTRVEQSLRDLPPYIKDYYKSIDFKHLRGEDLRAALHTLVYNHTALSYNALWDAFQVLDKHKEGCPPGLERGIYSGHCWDMPKQDCGSYKKEGDCCNREHTWPKGWWGGFSKGHHAQTDLFDLFLSDGYVNNLRSNNPFGEVDRSTVTYNSTNGSLVGKCNPSIGYDGHCFEPPDYFKGVLARAQLYVTTTYMGEFTCCSTVATNKADMLPWYKNLMVKWDTKFGVTDVEKNQTDVVFNIYQHNRNPYIDIPGLAALVFPPSDL